jgi:hypothetical protein
MEARAQGWLDEVVAVRLLRRGWKVPRVARATGLPRDLLWVYVRRIKAECTGGQCPCPGGCACVGPPPRVVDAKAAALIAARCGRLCGTDED